MAKAPVVVDASQRLDVRVDVDRGSVLDRIEMLEQPHDLERAALLALHVVLRTPEREREAGEEDRRADRDEPGDQVA